MVKVLDEYFITRRKIGASIDDLRGGEWKA
nr:MAG TPA: hypothetical protein [Caudoviricetes sp.]